MQAVSHELRGYGAGARPHRYKLAPARLRRRAAGGGVQAAADAPQVRRAGGATTIAPGQALRVKPTRRPEW